MPETNTPVDLSAAPINIPSPGHPKWATFLKVLEMAFGIFNDLNTAGVIKVKEAPKIDAIHDIVAGHVLNTFGNQPPQ